MTETKIDELFDDIEVQYGLGEHTDVLKALCIRGLRTMTITDLEDEIRRRDEIINSNKTLTVDLIEALDRIDVLTLQKTNLEEQVKRLLVVLEPFSEEGVEWNEVPEISDNQHVLASNNLRVRDLRAADNIRKTFNE